MLVSSSENFQIKCHNNNDITNFRIKYNQRITQRIIDFNTNCLL